MVNDNNGKQVTLMASNAKELSATQIEAAEMLASGEYLKKQIAEKLGIHKNTLIQWCKKPKFQETIKEITEEKHRRTLAMLNTATPIATERLIELIKSSDSRTALEACRYVIDRTLGKTTAKIEVENKDQHTININLAEEVERIKRDLIEAEYADLDDIKKLNNS